MRLCVVLATLVAATSALLVAAGPASGENTVAGTATAVVPTESAAPVESQAPVELTEEPSGASEAAPSEPAEPAEPTAIADAVDSVGTAVDSVGTAVAEGPVAEATSDPAIPSPPASAPRAAAAVSQVTTTVDSISTAVTSTDPVSALPDATAVHGSENPVSRIVESVRQGSARTIESVLQGSTNAIAPVTERLPLNPAAPALELTDRSTDRLLDPVASTTIETLLPTVEPSQVTAEERVTPGQLGLPEPAPADLLARWGTIAPGGLVEAPPTLSVSQLSKVRRVGMIAPEGPNPPSEALPLTMSGDDATLAPSGNHLRGPAPSDVPSPAPESPSAVAPGSAHAFFVPIAALLALLALVAPAIQRRFRGAADFRAPTPFTCALERPG